MTDNPQKGEIIQTTDASFDADVLKQEGKVLVDFWAPWCGPCKAIAPLLEEIANERAVRVAKVNIDENSKMAEHYEVRAIPTLLAFKDGQLQGTRVGAVGKTELEELLGD